MVSREHVSVVKRRESVVILPKTDMVFCETDMVGMQRKGNGD
jgi:hypothetical protein